MQFLKGIQRQGLGVALAASLFLTGFHPVWADSTPHVVVQTLSSGQTVYVEPLHAEPIVTIDTWVNTGSAQENPENNGVSHFLEHLLFKGTPSHPVGQIDQILESRGAEFNAATSNDFTHYHITTNTRYFKEALALHADMLANATINTPELDRERKVVQEEINRSLDNPQRKAYIELEKALFGAHPYAMDTLGPKSNIQDLPRESILGYYHQWYQPANFKTVIAGDIDPTQAVADVDVAFSKAYGATPRPGKGEPTKYPVEPLNAPKAVVLSDPNLSVAYLTLGFLAPPASRPKESAALDVAALILGQGDSSRLNRVLKEDQQLVNDVNASNSTQQQASLFVFNAETQPDKREAAQKALLAELARFKAQGPTEAEMAKAKRQVVKDFAFLNESTEGVAQSIGYNVTIATLDDYTHYVDLVNSVSAADVKAAVNQYLDLPKSVWVTTLPGTVSDSDKAQVAETTKTLLAQAPLAPTASPSVSAPEAAPAQAILTQTLPSGATLIMKPSPQTETVALSIFAKGGQLSESRPGTAALMARLLLKGTQTRSAESLHETLESQGLDISASADKDTVQVTATSLKTDFDKLLWLLSDVLLSPAFTQSELDKERTDMLDGIRSNRDTPSGLLFEKLTEALYPGHPYGAVGAQVEAALPKVTRRDVESYYQKAFSPQNLVITLVGNVDTSSAKDSLAQLMAQLAAKNTQSAQQAPKPVVPLKKPVEVAAQKPEQAATWIAYGWQAPSIHQQKDYVTLKVINTLLGSGLSSRLFVDLREKQGLAYHVSSLFPSSQEAGRFVMYIGTDPKNEAQVLRGFDAEIERLKTEPVSAEELERVKSKLTGQFALAHESNASQAYYLGLFQISGVGYGFDASYPTLVDAVTPQDILTLSQTLFNQPKVVAIVSPKAVRTEAGAQ